MDGFFVHLKLERCPPAKIVSYIAAGQYLQTGRNITIAGCQMKKPPSPIISSVVLTNMEATVDEERTIKRYSKQKESMKKALSLIACLSVFLSMETTAQVNTVEFGKNRVQYQKFKWKYYQT